MQKEDQLKFKIFNLNTLMKKINAIYKERIRLVREHRICSDLEMIIFVYNYF